MNKKKLLVIPLEIYKREFFYTLYLSLIAIDKGFQVIIGEQHEPIFKKLKHGIFYHKDHANWSRNLILDAKQRYMKIAIFDIEGLIYPSEEDYINTRISKDIFDISEFIFCWGENQKRLINKIIKNTNNIYITGSPKIDISNLIAKKISAKHKNIYAQNILVNTRFAVNNGVSYEVELKNLKELGVIKTQDDINLFKDFYESDVKIYNEFILLVKDLSYRKNINITIRPHPMEINETYINLFSKFNNVIVDNKSQLTDQFLAHDCVIHDGCTTAVEARACGLPVFGLRPSNLKNAYSSYSNKHSLNFSSHQNLINYLTTTKIENYNYNIHEKNINKSIKNWSNNDLSASYDIVNKFSSIDLKARKIIKPNKIIYFNIKTFILDLFDRYKFLNYIVKFLLFKKYNVFIRSRAKVNHKFPDIDFNSVISNIKSLNNLDPKTVRFKDICINEISRKSFVIYKSE